MLFPFDIASTSVSSLDCSSLYTGAFGNPDNPNVCYVMPDQVVRTWQEAVDFCSGITGGNYKWFVLEIKDATEEDYLRSEIRSMTRYGEI